MSITMQDLARDEEMMARSKRVIKDLKYRFKNKPDGAGRLAMLLRRHFDVFVDKQIVTDIWQDMAENKEKARARRFKKAS